MARKVFFSFDFDDVMAVNVVRNSNVVQGPDRKLPFADHSLYVPPRIRPKSLSTSTIEAAAKEAG